MRRESNGILGRYWRAFRFSFYVFTKIGRKGVYKGRQNALVTVEWLVGFVVWALLVIAISYRVPLLRQIMDLLGIG